MCILKNFENWVYYINAIRNIPDGKYQLAQEIRLRRKLDKLLKEQMNYYLDSNKIEDVFSQFETEGVREDKKILNSVIANTPNQQEIAETINATQTLVIERGGRRSIKNLKLGEVGIAWQDVEGKASAFLGKKLSHELSNAKGTIHDTTITRINDILLDSYEKKLTYTQTAVLIEGQGQAGVFSRARGELIAVRETRVAYEKGANLPVKEFKEQNPDRETLKAWSTVGDEKVTPSHTENEDQGFIDIDDTFNGTGDDTAPASDQPRCRCATQYDIK